MTPSPPSADLIALAGIAGTLLGTLVGSFVTWRVQKAQLEHQDRTRFHERRLSIYAEFNDACNNVVASMISSGIPGAEFLTAVRSFEMLRLVASNSVALAATTVHAAVLAVTTSQPGNRQQLVNAFSGALATLVIAMRKEIGV